MSIQRLVGTTLAVLATPLSGPLASAQESAAVFDASLLVADEFSQFGHVLDLDADGFPDTFDWGWPADDYLEVVRLGGWINDQAGRLVETWTLDLVMPGGNGGPFAGSGAGDLDGDPRDDFAIAFGTNVWLYGSNGAAAPSLLANVTVAGELGGLVLADFTGDGLDDLAVTAGAEVQIHENLGRGLGFSLAGSFAFEGESEIYLSEVNGDGSPDLMNVKSGRIVFYEIAGAQLAGQFDLSHALGGPVDTRPILGDVDGDGDDDVVVFRHDEYKLFRRTGPSTFSPEPLVAGGPATHLADVDGDGDLDGACCGSGGGPPPGGTTINVLSSFFEISLNDGTGTFAPAYALEGFGAAATGLAGAADLDLDGDVDLVAGRVVYYASGEDGLASPPHAGVAPGALLDAHAVDADGDGDVDFAFDLDGQVRNLADGTFVAGTTMVVPQPAPGSFWRGPGHPGDFDGDGDADLLVSEASNTFSFPVFEGAHLLLNNGAGALTASQPAADPALFMNTSGLVKWWDDPAESIVADVDADGDLDLLSRSWEGMASAVFLNDGSGFFTAGQQLPGEVVQHVTHLDGDGVPDLVVVDGSSLGVRMGSGGGAFGPLVLLPASQVLEGDLVGVGDLDGDGDADLAEASGTGVVLHWNDGNAAFATDTTTLGGLDADGPFTDERRVHVLDVDLDGRDDLVVQSVGQASTSSWIFRQEAGGTLAAPVTQVLRPTTFQDVDGDGDLDAVVDDYSTNDTFPDTPARAIDNLTFDEPEAGRIVQYGEPGAGTGGIAPVLGASGPLRVGEIVTVHLTGVPAGSLGLVGIGLDAAELPNTPWLGVTTYTWPWFSFFLVTAFGPGVTDGDGGLDLPYLVEADYPAVGPVSVQAYFADPGAPAGRVFTNGLLLEHE